ncbi:MAG: hypothetical protein BGO98_06145 [Myxococcales bacterium 68-20]|nr:hypothetical protein [Myxococcales bacterium]OJY26600.1 MAG: hypothetical protein BGO98_06145 [Myxococcales bacterium 68-20]
MSAVSAPTPHAPRASVDSPSLVIVSSSPSSSRAGTSASASTAPVVASVGEPLPTLDEAMRTHIGRALGLTRGRIEGRGGAADLLGVNPHTLRGKMRRLKIDWSAYRT